MIGSLGDIVFETSYDHIHTFNELSFTRAANFASHNILAKYELLEFTGLKAQTCSMKIELRSDLGINPFTEIMRLHEIIDNHEAISFMLGEKVIGRNLWVIESMTENYNNIDNKGNILSASINLSLKEYLNNV